MRINFSAEVYWSTYIRVESVVAAVKNGISLKTSAAVETESSAAPRRQLIMSIMEFNKF